MEIDPTQLKGFTVNKVRKKAEISKDVKKTIELINDSERPVIILGGGAEIEELKVLERIIQSKQIPFALTWAGNDYYKHENELFVGTFGVTSSRYGNFAVQNADLILAMGTRLDTHEVGSNIKNFARNAKRIVVDLDEAEQEKYSKLGWETEILCTVSTNTFIRELEKEVLV